VIFVTVDSSITPEYFHTVLNFLYHGNVPENVRDLRELKRVAAMMGVVELERVIVSMANDDKCGLADNLNKFQDQLFQRITDNFLTNDLLFGTSLLFTQNFWNW